MHLLLNLTGICYFPCLKLGSKSCIRIRYITKLLLEISHIIRITSRILILLLFSQLSCLFNLTYLSLNYCIFCLLIIQTNQIIQVLVWIVSLLLLLLIFLLVHQMIWQLTTIHHCFDEHLTVSSNLNIDIIKNSWFLIRENAHCKNDIIVAHWILMLLCMLVFFKLVWITLWIVW